MLLLTKAQIAARLAEHGVDDGDVEIDEDPLRAQALLNLLDRGEICVGAKRFSPTSGKMRAAFFSRKSRRN